jgi:CMP-N-acetylneuraminic acid synthetase
MNIAFIPVRGGSKSIPGKNIKDFAGKPLVWWTLSELQRSNIIGHIILATDDPNIKSTVQSFGFNKVIVYDRSPHNAKDDSTTESVILEYLDKNPHQSDDLFILVQATSPFTKKEDFENALNMMLTGNFDSVLTCSRIKRFIWCPEGKPINYDINQRPRRQNFEGLLVENGAFYISKIENILKSQNRISGKIGIYEINDERAFIEIDEILDWNMAEFLKRNE